MNEGRAWSSSGPGRPHSSNLSLHSSSLETSRSQPATVPRSALFTKVHTSGDVINRLEVILGKGSLNQDGMEMEYRRSEALRHLCAPLLHKRIAKERIENRISTRSGSNVSWLSMFWFWIRNSYKKSIGKIIDQGNYYTLWASAIKAIEGRYGSGVGTFFRFLRFLLFINCFSFSLSFCFLVIPQIIDRTLDNGTSVANPYNGPARFQDFLTGQGWLRDTELFYGFYKPLNLNISSSPFHGNTYNMSQAYFYTSFCVFLLTLVWISIKMARSYRRNFIEAQGADVKSTFIQKTFCSWDFAVTEGKAIKMQASSMVNQIKEVLESRDREKWENLSSQDQCLRYSISVIINLFIVGALVGIGFLADFIINELGSNENQDDFWKVMALPLSLSCLMLMVPIVFAYLSRVETSISFRSKIYMNLTRTVLLEAVILGMVIIKYLDHTGSQFDFCWETRLGQEMYRFMIVFFFVLVILSSLIEMLHILLHSKLGFFWLGAPRFDIAKNTMNLIYAQTVAWLGFYFSPMLPLVLMIILVINFYLKILVLRMNPNLVRKPWRAAQSQTIFHIFGFLSFIGSVVAVVYVFIRHLSDSYPYEIIADTQFFTNFFLFKPAVVMAFIVGICVAIFYIRALSVARAKAVQVLRERIKAEGMEKALLISLMERMEDKGEKQY